MKIRPEDRLDLGEILKESYEKDLILEGGAAGHMMHLYEDGKMTFGEMRSILHDVFQGKTTMIEKCLSPDTKLILKDHGETKIKDVVDGKIEDDVLTLDDKGNIVYSPITNWFDNGMKTDWYKVVCDDGTELICTPEHKFIDGSGNEVVAAELKVGDFVVSSH